MIFEIPYWYQARVIVRGGRVPTEFTVVDTLPVSIPDFSRSEARTEACITPAKGDWSLDYLRIDGRLVRQLPLGRLDDFGSGVATGQEQATNILRGWVDRGNDRWAPTFGPIDGDELRNLPGRKITTAAELNPGQWLGDNRDDRANRMRHLFESQAAVLDGSLWVPTAGPCHAITTTYGAGDDGHYGMHVRSAPTMEMGALLRASAAVVLPASRASSAAEYLASERTEKQGRWPKHFSSVDIGMRTEPDTDLASVQEYLALAIATWQMTQTYANLAHKLDDSGMLLFADLREALDPDALGTAEAILAMGNEFMDRLKQAKLFSAALKDNLTTYHALRKDVAEPAPKHRQ